MAILLYRDLGRAAYGPTLELQRALWSRVAGTDDELAYLLLVEHFPAVITLGRGAKPRHVLASPDQLARAGVEVHASNRGGNVTWHGPGQLVAYPILRLDLHGQSVRGYLRALERAVIAVLAALGIEGKATPGLTGVWVGDQKVAAIGVAVRRWVCYHGLSLNVSADLAGFDLIVPCGLADKRVTSISGLLGRDVSVSQVKPLLIQSIAEEFGFESSRPDSSTTP